MNDVRRNMELQTMPLRFRVWDKEKKKFLLENADLDGYSALWAGAGVGGQDEVVSQDTGLKDNNGESIYTGDIIRDVDDGYLSVVKYGSGECVGVDPVTNEVVDGLYLIGRDGEIVGNIWQNPELLEGE